MGRSLASGECSEVRTVLSGSQVEETLPQFPGSQRPGLPHDPLCYSFKMSLPFSVSVSPLSFLFFLVGQLLSLPCHCTCRKVWGRRSPGS